MKQFISWRRVSTKKQGRSGLGLEAQAEIISHFVGIENGELVKDYCEVYTGTELSGCTELRKAIDHCKAIGATLIIAKSDRFRNTIEALKIYEEMGDGNIYFCDLPHTDKFTLTLFFALAEREAMITAIRTKAALDAKKSRGEATGGTNELWGKNTGADRGEAITKMVLAASESRVENAKRNPNNIEFWKALELWEAKFGRVCKYGKTPTDFDAMADWFNKRGLKTSTGMEFNPARIQSMCKRVKRIFSNG